MYLCVWERTRRSCQHTRLSVWDVIIKTDSSVAVIIRVCGTIAFKHVIYQPWVCGLTHNVPASWLFFFFFSFLTVTHSYLSVVFCVVVVLIVNNTPNIWLRVLAWPWPVCSGALISNNNSLSWQLMCKQHSFILTWQPCHSLSVDLLLPLVCLHVLVSPFLSFPLGLFSPSGHVLSPLGFYFVCLSLSLPFLLFNMLNLFIFFSLYSNSLSFSPDHNPPPPLCPIVSAVTSRSALPCFLHLSVVFCYRFTCFLFYLSVCSLYSHTFSHLSLHLTSMMSPSHAHLLLTYCTSSLSLNVGLVWVCLSNSGLDCCHI